MSDEQDAIDDISKRLSKATSGKRMTCPKCGHTFNEPLVRTLPFTQEQYREVVRTYGENFQICPNCKNVFNPAQPAGPGGKCFVATAVYGNYDAPEVQKLRYFRDRYLNQSHLGRAFITLYYKYGPRLASAIDNKPAIKRLLRRILQVFL